MSILRRVANLFRCTAVNREIEREMTAHIEMRIEDNIARGMSVRDARRDALVCFGNPAAMRERTAGEDAAVSLEGFWRDLRFALRQLRKAPGFTAAALLTLALAIGANAAVFTVVHAVLLKRLPFDEPARVLHVENGYAVGLSLDTASKSYEASFNNAASSLKTIDAAAMYSSSGVSVDWGNGVSSRARATETSARLLDVLGVNVQIGRGFEAGEDIPGSDHVVLIGDAIWRGMFQADRDVLGRTLKINGTAFTIAGVLPRGVDFPEKTELWTPTIFDEQSSLREGGAFFTQVIARMRRGVTMDQVRAEFHARALHGRIARLTEPQIPVLTPISMELTKLIRSSLLMLIGAVSIVLLIACANIACLMLVRAAGRRAEFAVRAALGASQSRLIRQQIVESILIGLGGGVLGIECAQIALRLLYVFRPAVLDSFARPAMDLPVIAFTALLGVATGLVFGIAPAWTAARENPSAALKTGVWRSSSSISRLRKVLVAGEIALAFVLLTGVGLLVRTIANMSIVPLGFETQGRLTFSVSLHGTPYDVDGHTTPAVVAFYTRVLGDVSALPGVTAVAAVSNPPLDTRADMLLGVSSDTANVKPTAAAPRFVSSGYFSAMGIPIAEGRDFSPQDTRTSGRVVIITRDLAEKLWPNEHAVGHKMRCLWYCKETPTVVGVVAQSRRYGPRGGTFPEYYMPYTQQDWSFMTFVVKAQGDPTRLAPALRRVLARIDPTQPAYDLRTMQDRLNENESLVRFELFVLSGFGVISVALALIGLHGVASYTVTQRTREIGLRIALGAQRRKIQWAVLRENGLLALAGGTVGMLASLALTQLLSSVLFGVHARDPLTLGLIFVLFVAMALVASFLPALRAASVNPIEALRAE
jgi:putative ABC transport system permease protein